MIAMWLNPVRCFPVPWRLQGGAESSNALITWPAPPFKLCKGLPFSHLVSINSNRIERSLLWVTKEMYVIHGFWNSKGFWSSCTRFLAQRPNIHIIIILQYKKGFIGLDVWKVQGESGFRHNWMQVFK